MCVGVRVCKYAVQDIFPHVKAKIILFSDVVQVYQFTSCGNTCIHTLIYIHTAGQTRFNKTSYHANHNTYTTITLLGGNSRHVHVDLRLSANTKVKSQRSWHHTTMALLVNVAIETFTKETSLICVVRLLFQSPMPAQMAASFGSAVICMFPINHLSFGSSLGYIRSFQIMMEGLTLEFCSLLVLI